MVIANIGLTAQSGGNLWDFSSSHTQEVTADLEMPPAKNKTSSRSQMSYLVTPIP